MEQDLFGDQEMDNFKDLKSPHENLKEIERKRILESLESTLKKIEKSLDKMGGFGGTAVALGTGALNAHQIYSFNHSLGNSANVMASPAAGEIERLAKTPLEAAMFQMFGTSGLYKKGPYRTNPLVSYYYNEQGASDILRKGTMDLANVGLGAAGIGLTMAGMPLLAAGVNIAGLPLLNTARKNLQSEMKTHSDLLSTAGSHIYGLNSKTIIGEGFTTTERQGIADMVKAEAYDDKWWDMGDVNDLLSTTTQSKMYRSVRSAEEFKDRFKNILEASKKVSLILSQTLDEAGQTLSKMRLTGIYDIPTMQEFAIRQENTRIGAGLSRSDTFNITASVATYSQQEMGNREVGGKLGDFGTGLAGLAVGRYTENGPFIDEKHRQRIMDQAEEQKADLGMILGRLGVDSIMGSQMTAKAFKQDEKGNLVLDENFLKGVNNGSIRSFQDIMGQKTNLDGRGMVELSSNLGEYTRVLMDRVDPVKMQMMMVEQLKARTLYSPNMDDKLAKTMIMNQFSVSDAQATSMLGLFRQSDNGSLQRDLYAQQAQAENRELGSYALKEGSIWAKKAGLEKAYETIKNNIVSPAMDGARDFTRGLAEKQKSKYFTRSAAIESKEEYDALMLIGMQEAPGVKKSESDYTRMDLYNVTKSRETGDKYLDKMREYRGKMNVLGDFRDKKSTVDALLEVGAIGKKQEKTARFLDKELQRARRAQANGQEFGDYLNKKRRRYHNKNDDSDDFNDYNENMIGYHIDLSKTRSWDSYFEGIEKKNDELIRENAKDNPVYMEKVMESTEPRMGPVNAGLEQVSHGAHRMVKNINPEYVEKNDEFVSINVIQQAAEIKKKYGSMANYLARNHISTDGLYSNRDGKGDLEKLNEKRDKGLTFLYESKFADDYLTDTQDSLLKFAVLEKELGGDNLKKVNDLFDEKGYAGSVDYTKDKEKEAERLADILMGDKDISKYLTRDQALRYAYGRIDLTQQQDTLNPDLKGKDLKKSKNTSKMLNNFVDEKVLPLLGSASAKKEMRIGVDLFLQSDKRFESMDKDQREFFANLATAATPDERNDLYKKYGDKKITTNQAAIIGNQMGVDLTGFADAYDAGEFGDEVTISEFKSYIGDKATVKGLQKLSDIPESAYGTRKGTYQEADFRKIYNQLGFKKMEEYLENMSSAVNEERERRRSHSNMGSSLGDLFLGGKKSQDSYSKSEEEKKGDS